MHELFSTNEKLKDMNAIRRQHLRALREWIQYQESSDIDIELFTEDILYSQCDHLSAERDSGCKVDSYKSQENPFVWDGDIFKLGV